MTDDATPKRRRYVRNPLPKVPRPFPPRIQRDIAALRTHLDKIGESGALTPTEALRTAKAAHAIEQASDYASGIPAARRLSADLSRLSAALRTRGFGAAELSELERLMPGAVTVEVFVGRPVAKLLDFALAQVMLVRNVPRSPERAEDCPPPFLMTRNGRRGLEELWRTVDFARTATPAGPVLAEMLSATAHRLAANGWQPPSEHANGVLRELKELVRAVAELERRGGQPVAESLAKAIGWLEQPDRPPRRASTPSADTPGEQWHRAQEWARRLAWKRRYLYPRNYHKSA